MTHKPIIYQVFTRLYGNRNTTRKEWGSVEENGTGKFSDFDTKTLKAIKQMGVSHIWYTGVIRHASQTNFSKFGIPTQHPSVVKGKAGSPYAICDYYDVDPDLADNVNDRMKEFETLVSRTHKAGLKMFIDFVPNHVARQYLSIAKPKGVVDLGADDDKNQGFNPQNNFYYCPGLELDLTSILESADTYSDVINIGLPSLRGRAGGEATDYSEYPAKATGNDHFDNRPGMNDWYETVKLNYGIDYWTHFGHFDPIPDTWKKMTEILLFWASKNDKAGKEAEESIFNMFGFSEQGDDPNKNIEQVRKVFRAIYSDEIKTTSEDKFYILGLAPNSARIAVVYWAEIPLREFAGTICKHFNDMEVVDIRLEKKPYMSLRNILSTVTLGGKVSDATPNLPDAIVKSIFQGLPYPQTLFASCIRRVRAESGDKDRNPINITRAAIIKAYLNRLNNNQIKIEVMLDKDNNNQGYLCGRLFAVLDKIQEEANNQHSIRERYMNSASSTPAAVFSTILNLSNHHVENLKNEGRKIYFEKLKQEIISKIDADGFKAQLDLQDQGRFFIGFYHQRQDFFMKNEEDNNN